MPRVQHDISILRHHRAGHVENCRAVPLDPGVAKRLTCRVAGLLPISRQLRNLDSLDRHVVWYHHADGQFVSWNRPRRGSVRQYFQRGRREVDRGAHCVSTRTVPSSSVLERAGTRERGWAVDGTRQSPGDHLKRRCLRGVCLRWFRPALHRRRCRALRSDGSRAGPDSARSSNRALAAAFRWTLQRSR